MNYNYYIYFLILIHSLKFILLVLGKLNDLELSLTNSILIGNEFKVIKKIDEGSYGSVYSGISVITSLEVAIKVENLETFYPSLKYEYQKYLHINNSEYFPKILWTGVYTNYYVLVMEQLGNNIDQYIHTQKARIENTMISMIGEQIITAIEILHNKSLLHKDIKPNNILLSKNITNSRVYLIDLGSSDFYCSGSFEKSECLNPFDSKGIHKRWNEVNDTNNSDKIFHHQHIEYQDGLELVGTPRYASLNALQGIQLSRRDDLESFGYTLIYFYRDLPWQGISNREITTTEMITIIKLSKIKATLQELTFGLPDELYEYFKYVRGLGFYEKPNYEYLRFLMVRLGRV